MGPAGSDLNVLEEDEMSRETNRVRFAAGVGDKDDDASSTVSEMDRDVAQRLFEVGASLVLLDVPIGTEVGIDVNSWNVAHKFKGIKMIPPGIHFVYWSVMSERDRQMSPRTGFFYNFDRSEVLAKRLNPSTEAFDDVSPKDTQNIKAGIRDIDSGLGPYPYNSWKEWVGLTSRISPQTLSRLEPTKGGLIHAVSQLVPETHKTTRGEGTSSSCPKRDYLLPENLAKLDEDPAQPTPSTSNEADSLPSMACMPGTNIRYSGIPSRRYPEGATPAEITRHSMDATFQLDSYLETFKKLYGDAVSSGAMTTDKSDEALAELQFSFVCFLVGQHYDSFEQWKQMLKLFCQCDQALSDHPDLYMALIRDLYFQIREVPDDFFLDIVSSNNFLVNLLTSLFLTAKHNEGIPPRLKDRLEKFRTNLSQKFKWDFSFEDGDEVDEEDRPVVVEM